MRREEKKHFSRGPCVAEAYCPMSGVRIEGVTIKPHKIDLHFAKNGSLFGVCQAHIARIFINDPDLIEKAKRRYQELQEEESNV